MRYSSGEWTAKKVALSGQKPFWRVETDVQILCIVSDSDGQPAEANAHLMATAKELLVALDAMMIFEPHEQYNEDGDPENVAIKQARQAIAKVKGE